MKKKLIEVALPLDIINDASAYDKLPGIGAHPKGIHQWWARLPLPAARAILFASIIDDPSENNDKFPSEEEQNNERERLFGMIKELCQKKAHLKQKVFNKANEEIRKQCGNNLPTVLDPFAGGGSIPLEAMRLGLPVTASDLNPVAVLINKIMLEILPEFEGHPPINPENRRKAIKEEWKNAHGLAEDLSYYGKAINEEAKKQIGDLYPPVKINGKEHKVIAWIWARTVKCPNPICNCNMPLIRSFVLRSKQKSNIYAWPIIERSHEGNQILGYEITEGNPPKKGTIKSSSGAVCICCAEPVKFGYIRNEGKENRIGFSLIAIVADTGNGKSYVNPQIEHEKIAKSAKPNWYPKTNLPEKALGFRVQSYGMDEHWKLFRERQLHGLNTIREIIEKTCENLTIDLNNNHKGYINALKALLLMALDRCADFNNSLTRWNASNEKVMNLFGRQVIPMVWDFGEANLLENYVGGWLTCVNYISKCIKITLTNISTKQTANQFNASKYSFPEENLLISTDPPYYDNIGYSDLSDFFYVWLRKGLQNVFPELFSTVLVPKMEELVASEFRFGDKESAKDHFEEGFREAFGNFRKGIDQRFPMTVYYAFKQDEASSKNTDATKNVINLTTGWETILEGLISSGFQITATWPIRASQQWRLRAMGSNALASYIVMVCRKRDENASYINRRQFVQELRDELEKAVVILQSSNLAPVDFAQASLGPGMAVFSKYENVLESDGSSLSVRTAISLINQILDEIFSEQEGDFDADTRWAIGWYQEYTFREGPYGIAETLSTAKNTSVSGLEHAGILKSGGGKVKLLSREELENNWDPRSDKRATIWEATQYLTKALLENGENGAALLYKALGPQAETARELAYRLYNICEQKGWAQEAFAYNSLVIAWPAIKEQASKLRRRGQQTTLDL